MMTIYIILSVLILLIALFGTLVPMLPGLPLMALVYWVFGFLSHWQYYGQSTAGILLIVTGLAYAFDYYATVMGAKKFGAGKEGMLGAILGLIIGVVFFNLPGLILGPIVGAIAGEMLAGKTTEQSVKAGWGTFIGFMASTIVRFTLALIYFIYFIWVLF